MTPQHPGDTVVLRYFKRGRPSGAIPTRAISMSDGPVLWLAPGTIVSWPAIGDRQVEDVPLAERFTVSWDVIERPWVGDGILIVARPERAHAIWLFWDRGAFVGWYINLEDSWRTSPIGFDTQDHELDIWVEPDGSWRWKDELDLEEAVEAGVFSADQAASFRAEGERVIAEWPFPTGWEEWCANPSWPVPSAPHDWADQPKGSPSQRSSVSTSATTPTPQKTTCFERG